MIKLTGIGAFEACWRSLKTMYSINPDESQMLMQSMGRLVDNYASQAEIAAELSLPLRKLFNLLVQSYLEGYWVEDTATSRAATNSEPGTEAIAEAGADVSTRSVNLTSADADANQFLSSKAVAAAQRRQLKPHPTTASEADTYITSIAR